MNTILNLNLYKIVYYLFLFYTLLYIVIMCIYAADFIIIRKKEEFWENASDDNILEKALSIVRKYDKNACLNDKKVFTNTIIKLNEYHMEFKIACYREGIKKRLKEVIAESKNE